MRRRRVSTVVAVIAVLVAGGALATQYLGRPRDDCAPYAVAIGPLHGPYVTSDEAGDVFILDSGESDHGPARVLMLTSAAPSAVQLPFPPLEHPSAITAGHDGAVMVYDEARVVKLTPATGHVQVIDFPGRNASVKSIAASGGRVWVLDSTPEGTGDRDHLYSRDMSGVPGPTLDAGATWLMSQLAGDGNGDVYVSDVGAVAKAGSDVPTVMSIAGVSEPWSMTVDAAGAIYVVDHSGDGARVVATTAGKTKSMDIPAGFSFSSGIGVDRAGNVYVADYSQNRILKLPANHWTE